MLNESPLRILVIDDNPDDLGIISRFLGRCPWKAEIVSAETGQEALVRLGEENCDLAFLDLRLPDVNGLELLESVIKIGNMLPVIMVTGQGDEKAAVSAMKAGAYDYIVKDELTADLLTKTISHALEKKRFLKEKAALEQELFRYTSSLEEMVRERTAEVEYLNDYKEHILASLNDYIRVVDPVNKVIQYESEKIKDEFGESVGKPCYGIWNRDTECENCISQKAIEGWGPHEKEEDGGERKFRVLSIPLRNRDGSVSAIEVITDITEAKRLGEEVERSRRLAVMGEISAHMAHEVRQPLVALKLACKLFTRRHTSDPKEQQIIDIIQNAASTLEALVHDILDFSRPPTLNLESVDLLDVVSGTIGEIDFGKDNKDIAVVKRFPDAPVVAHIDILRFKSILKNLISNSMQAIPTAGTITVSVSADADRRLVTLRGSDTGRGIPEEDLKKIFDSFFTTRKGGTGVGMCIVKKFVEAHGGTIEVQSKVDRGTDVTVTLPMLHDSPLSVCQTLESDETALMP